MSLAEKQHAARLNFINSWLNGANVVANYNDKDIIIATADKDFPYIKVSVAALNEEIGDNKITELIEKQKYSDEWKLRRTLKWLRKNFNVD